jgi:ribulose-phosphate 3-epimerase
MTNSRANEIIPAILVKTRKELLEKIEKVMPHVKTIQIDVMDGKFVPNITTNEIFGLPNGKVIYEYHWMVEKPWEWIEKVKTKAIHLVHIETIGNSDGWELTKAAVKRHNGKLGVAVNPETYLDKIYPIAKDISMILVMTVKPGFSGQTYMYSMAKKIHEARHAFPELDIEVDGGIGLETIPHAKEAGANKFAAASAIYAQPDISKAIAELKKVAGV